MVMSFSEQHFQVRGTPACGKTTLSKLIAAHMKTENPTTRVVWLDSWIPQVTQGDWCTYLRQRWKVVPDDGSILVLDDAQVSYWDVGLWNFLRAICTREYNNRAIAFTSRGSPTSISTITPITMVIPSVQKVTLRPIDHHDDT